MYGLRMIFPKSGMAIFSNSRIASPPAVTWRVTTKTSKECKDGNKSKVYPG